MKLVLCWKLYTGSLVTFTAAKSAASKSCVSYACHAAYSGQVSRRASEAAESQGNTLRIFGIIAATLDRLTIARTGRDLAKISHKDR